jgi:hypothetical protein
MSLYDRFDYMTHKRNIVWLGPTGVDFRTAVLWLQRHLAAGPPAIGTPAADALGREPAIPERPRVLRLPVRDDRLLGRCSLLRRTPRRTPPIGASPL